MYATVVGELPHGEGIATFVSIRLMTSALKMPAHYDRGWLPRLFLQTTDCCMQ